MEPLISIIIPVYKVESYLRRCVDSVINQTYKNIEIILIDDGSPDNSPAICDEYAKIDNRITVIHKENGGLSDARNAGINKSSGKYLYFLDGDDSLPNKAIENLVFASKTSDNIDFIFGEMQIIQNKHSLKQHFSKTTLYSTNLDIQKAFFKIRNRLPVNACNKLIRRDFLIQNNLFFKKNLIHEDELWMFYVAQKANKALYIEEITYNRYINPNSITTSSNDKKRKEAWGQIFLEILPQVSGSAKRNQLFAYISLLIYQYNSHCPQKIFDLVWIEIIKQAGDQKLLILKFLLKLYKSTYSIFKGHGFGFLIWLLTTHIYTLEK